MSKLLLVLACMVSLVAASVLDVRVLQGRGLERKDGQRISGMTQEDLQRQKFLLDILQHVQKPLQQDELISLDNGGLIVDEQRYAGGLDEEMQYVIELDRQRQLLDEHQVYTVGNGNHVRQLRGIYSLLVRAKNWDTVQRNIVYLRRNINPVLLVNVLALVIRDRADTQILTMPAIPEVLPQLYVDGQLVERVQSIGLQESVRPNLLDVLGMGQRLHTVNPMLHLIDRSPLWMPWRELRMQIALKKATAKQQQGRLIVGNETPVILPVEVDEQGMSLLTEDIGMRNFVQGLINELSLREIENEQQQERNNGRLGLVDDDEIELRGGSGFGVGTGIGVQSLPTININSGRLLKVSRRRQQQNVDASQGLANERERFFRVMKRNDDNDVDDDDQIQEIQTGRVGLERNIGQRFGTSVNNGGLLYANRRLQKNVKNDFESQRIVDDLRMQGKQIIQGEDDYIRGSRINQDNEDDISVRGRRINQGNYDITMRGGQYNEGVANLPTVDINSNRLLRVSRRRLDSVEQQRNDILGIGKGMLRGQRFSDGRRVEEEQQQQREQKKKQGNTGMNENVQQRYMQESRQGQYGIVGYGQQEQKQGQDVTQGRRLVGNFNIGRKDNVLEQIQNSGIQTDDDLESVRRDDLRLVRINKRRLNQQQEQQQPRRVSSIGEGRRILEDEDIMQLIRRDNRLAELSDDEIIQMLQRNRQNRRLQQQQEQQSQLNDSDDNDDDDDEQTQNRNSIRQGSRSRRSLKTIQQSNYNSRRNEILLHNLRQLVARLNQERISLGQRVDELQLNGNINAQRLNNPRLLANMDERYALRLNDMRLDSRRNRALLEQINEIERRLQLVIGQKVQQLNIGRGQLDEQRQVERIIGDVLLGRLGQVGILRIMRELLQNDIQSIDNIDRLGLGLRLSDPVVQYILRRIVSIVDEQREQQLGVYRREDLALNGVSINDVRVDKLRTRIENSDMDLANLLNGKQVQQQRTIVARQRRLNNKQFNIEMDISAERAQNVIIRLLLGPRIDAQGRELSLNERRGDFIVLDTVVTQLQAGRNRIQRSSDEINWTTRDVTPYSEIYRRVMLALRGELKNDFSDIVGENGRFPQRLLLPRGRPEGLPMQLLVIVSPLDGVQQQKQQQQQSMVGIGISSVDQDMRPLGYPLDRRIDNELALLELANVSVQDVLIIQEN